MTTKQQIITDRNNLHAARNALLAWQPEAMHVRLEGRCSNCGRSGCFVSYQLPDDLGVVRTDRKEPCGYFCRSCEFTAAGARKASEE